MKKLLGTAVFLFWTAALWAADGSIPSELLKKEPKEEPKKSLQSDPFSVSTEDLDLSENLNRVAGEIDLGFSSPSQSYEAGEHRGGGPTAHEKAQLAKT